MIINNIEKIHFSKSEQDILRYILRQGENISSMTIQDIAEATYTSAPLCIRIAKKLGFSGWSDFKKAFCDELEYMYKTQDVDASIPFLVTDDMTTIAQNLLRLHEATVEDTKELLKHDDLSKAVSLLRQTKIIDIYTKSNYTFLAEGFMQKMMSIHYQVNVGRISGSQIMQAAMSDKTHVAIIISYSGETRSMVQVAKKCVQNHTPIIAITSISHSTLSKLADVSLRISSREMLNTKIGEFATTESILCLLDILYGCIFSFDYDNNLENKLRIAKEIDDGYSEYEFIDEDQ